MIVGVQASNVALAVLNYKREGVRRLRRWHRRHHLGSLPLSVPYRLDLGLPAEHADGGLGLR
jgi:hypothetical protein